MKINSKYAIGQTVYIVANLRVGGKIIETYVKEDVVLFLKVFPGGIMYDLYTGTRREEEVFETKKEAETNLERLAKQYRDIERGLI